ncbi:MAG: lipopolysaccharide biosynthesis protein [Rhodanobacter sp.]
MTEAAHESDSRHPVRRVLTNFGYLMRGRAVAGLLMLAATALMARTLGPAQFGVAMLIESYYLLMRGLFDFNSFDSVVRFGVPLHADGDQHKLQRLIAVCRRVDRQSMVVGTAVSVLLAPAIGPYIGIEHGAVILLAGYSLVLLTEANNAASGVLRLFNRFDALGWQMTIGAAVTFVGVLVGWWLDATLYVFVIIMAVAQASENLYLSWRGWREYRQQIGSRLASDVRAHTRVAEFTGLRHFLWMCYWQSNLDLVPRHLAMLLAGNLLGTAGAGMLRLANQLSSLLSKSSRLIRDVAFPDLTRIWLRQREGFARLAYRTALLGSLVGLTVVVASYLWGADFLRVLVGKKFEAAAGLLTLMLLAATFDLASAPLRAAVYVMGRAGRLVLVYIVSTALYLTLFVVLSESMSLIGAGVAACAAAAMQFAVMAVIIHLGMRRRAQEPGR